MTAVTLKGHDMALAQAIQSPPVTDETLLIGVARREPTALALLYERRRATVFRQALQIAADPGVAADATQEVFLQVWLRAGQYDPTRGAASSWLRAVAHNVTLNQVGRRRKQAVVQRLDDEAAQRLVDGAVDVEEAVCAADRRRAVVAALADLPPAQRAVLVHAYYGGLSHVQIAARLGLPTGTVKSRIRTGLRRLRQSLEPAGSARFARAALPAWRPPSAGERRSANEQTCGPAARSCPRPSPRIRLS